MTDTTDPRVDAYIDALPGWQQAICREVRQRSTPPTRKAALKLVFATMIHAAERWCRVSVTDLERHQLKLLRSETRTRPTASNNRTQIRRKAVAA